MPLFLLLPLRSCYSLSPFLALTLNLINPSDMADVQLRLNVDRKTGNHELHRKQSAVNVQLLLM